MQKCHLVFFVVLSITVNLYASPKCKLVASSKKEFRSLKNPGFPEKFNHKLILKELKIDGAQKLGSGYRAKVYKYSDSKVIKIARYNEDREKFHLEHQTHQFLKKNFNKYGIRTDNIIKVDKDYRYFIKDHYTPKHLFAKKMASQLTKDQYKALESLFLSAVKIAEEHGIGLDIKASNLVWSQKHSDWVLIDAGPRTSYIPYGYTKALKNFKEYLKVWTWEEPDGSKL